MGNDQEFSLVMLQCLDIEGTPKKTLYHACVKSRCKIKGLQVVRFVAAYGEANGGSSVKDCAVATNRHLVHINPTISRECPFCREDETIFLKFRRLTGLFDIV